MNFKLVSRIVGLLLLLLAVAMGVCLSIGYFLPPGSGHSDATALNGWEVSMAITGLSSGLLLFLGRGMSNAHILRKDAMGMVGIGWIACCLFASLPYVFCEPKLDLAQAIFEAVSGLTTTGASVFEDLTPLPKTVLLWRSWTQWIGGMGILTMFVVVSASLGAGGKSLFLTESSVHTNEVIGITMRQTGRWLWLLYIVLTIICAAGLWALGMTPFQAINHAMTTVSTGGFGTENSSISEFGSAVRIWIIIFMFLCGLSFPLQVVLFRRREWKILKTHEETWMFAGIMLLAFVVLFIDRALAGTFGSSWGAEAVDTAFNIVSIATTTGFVVGDYDVWPPLAKAVIVFLMLLGGCAGSTAGGLKVSRLILSFKVLRAELQRMYRPNVVLSHTLNGRVVPAGSRGQLFIIVTSAFAAIAIGSSVLKELEPHISLDGCVAAVLSSISNVGPAFNEFGPTHNFAHLSGPSMILLSFLMVLGRLEYIALLVLLSRNLWRRY